MEAIPIGICQCGCGGKTKLADRNKKALGWIKGEPLKYLRGHSRMGTSVRGLPPNMKWCSGCKTAKEKSEFWSHRAQYDGLQPRCKHCSTAKMAVWRKDNRLRANEYVANGVRYKKTGVTGDQYRAMHEAQDGVCAICGMPERVKNKYNDRMLCLDHDHDTGKPRGLLCCNCNRALGLFGDHPSVVASALRYLAQHGKTPYAG